MCAQNYKHPFIDEKPEDNDEIETKDEDFDEYPDDNMQWTEPEVNITSEDGYFDENSESNFTENPHEIKTEKPDHFEEQQQQQNECKKQHECSFCEKSFAHVGHLKKHIRENHEEQSFNIVSQESKNLETSHDPLNMEMQNRIKTEAFDGEIIENPENSANDYMQNYIQNFKQFRYDFT